MLGYVTIGTSDMERSRAFWDKIAEAVGGKRMMDDEDGRYSFYGSDAGGAMLGVFKPFNEEPTNSGNGNMVALACRDHDHVEAVYKVAMELGAADEGGPGERIPGFFFGAYFRDPDNNKVCAYKMG